MSTGINTSLETHLLHVLNPISPILPQHLADDLAQYLVNPPPLSIPYNTLFAISQWTRTADGQKALQAHSIKASDYSMISLLAGTTSSPEGKFGTYIPPKEPEEIGAERVNERKSITALINALLSIGCVAFASWWAADKAGWRDEWRVLFALFAAIVVAISEAGLYMIWQYSKSKRSQPKKKSARHKKVDSGTNRSLVDSAKAIKDPPDEAFSTLRQRR
ncbi:hypothetical protein BYT27DRAFT_7153157 [Phlegmacium glaucopus]|nr:hypothetical protein BYT27DRAFT_7153157 [Phlegmacium glaucopus]